MSGRVTAAERRQVSIPLEPPRARMAGSKLNKRARQQYRRAATNRVPNMELAQRYQDYHHQVPDARDWIEERPGTDVRAGFDGDGDSGHDYARNQVEPVREFELRLVHSARNECSPLYITKSFATSLK